MIGQEYTWDKACTGDRRRIRKAHRKWRKGVSDVTEEIT